jgi:PPM family protein phosphatase
MNYRTCPNCKHRNLARASYCFECGENLVDHKLLPGAKPYHHPSAASHGRTDQTLKPLDKKDVDSTREDRESSSLYNAGLHCLRCSALNDTTATACHVCGAALIVPDEVHQSQTTGSARTSVGRVRTNNEDTVGLWGRHGIMLGLVADGMGGAAAGEEASRLAKEAVQADFVGALRGSESLFELSDLEIAHKLRMSITHANEALLERIKENSTLRGMGTTATIGMVRGGKLILAHVGDSRAYLINGKHGWIQQVTDDHSFVEALLASGHITRAQAERHPMRSVLYRALGQNEELGYSDIYMREVRPGDRIVLCSDGLPRHIADHEIASIAMQHDDPEIIAQSLIDLTNQRGAEDNVSVVAFVVQATDALTPIERLAPIPGEREEIVLSEEDAFSTGRIPPDELQRARENDATPDDETATEE